MTAKLAIRNIRARPVLVPFKRPPMSASGGIPRAALVLIDLETEDGITGRSYVFGFAPGRSSPSSAASKVRGLHQGRPVAPLDLEAKLRGRLTLLDTPGLVGLALAGIDMAAWDALAQAEGVPLVKLLGGEVRRCAPTTAAACGSSRSKRSPTKRSPSSPKAASAPSSCASGATIRPRTSPRCAR